MVFFFFFAVAPPGLFRPDVVPQTFFVIVCVGRRDLSAGPKQKKNTPPRVCFFFFFCGPSERQGKEKTTQVVFFLLRPRGKAGEGDAPLGAGTGPEQKKKNTTPAFPRAGAKTTPWVVFFFALAPCRRPTGILLPLPFAGAAAKKNKNTLGGVFSFARAPCRHGASPSPAFPRGRSRGLNN